MRPVTTPEHAPAATPARALLPLIVPALVVGIASSLLLLGLTELADQLKDVLWEVLPDALGIGRYSVLWMIMVLTATGLAVGLVVWKVPGTPVPIRPRWVWSTHRCPPGWCRACCWRRCSGSRAG